MEVSAILVYHSADEKFHSQVLLQKCIKKIESREIKNLNSLHGNSLADFYSQVFTRM